MTKRNRARTSARRRPAPSRRGVASVLAMIFLILFGSLAVAMAIASQGNIRTAGAHLHVMRAMSAAETGMAVAEDRLAHVISRFVVDRGVIDDDYAWNLWIGSTGGLGAITTLPLEEGTVPAGLADGLSILHALDRNVVVVDGVRVPTIASAPAGVDPEVYQSTNWLVTPAVGLAVQTGRPDPITNEVTPNGTGFQITYAPLREASAVRIIVTGYDFDQTRRGQPMTRTIMQDVQIVKRVNHAIISPSRVMIGKNVHVEGDLGATFTGVTYSNGHPIVLRSDFRGLTSGLDQTLTWFAASVLANDADLDNRLRVGHAVEGVGISIDTDGDLIVDYTFEDRTGDGYVDEFDLFLREFDTNQDGKVALSDDLRAGTPNEHLDAEFVDSEGHAIDDDLAYMIDTAAPDRNGNGLFGFVDTNSNGRWDPGSEQLNDHDPVNSSFPDHVLGYRDGVVDRRDLYAKVDGSLTFRVSQQAWANSQGSIRQYLQGPIRPDYEQNPVTFEASTSYLPEISSSNFTSAQAALRTAAVDGDSLARQTALQLGIAEASLPTYVETGANPNAPQFLRLDADANADGMPDNWSTAYYEKTPFNSPSFNDWYYRPVYRNMVFKDVEIPQGTNALFENCTFVGVTYVRTHADNTHVNYAQYGRMRWDDAAQRPVLVSSKVNYTSTSNLPTDILPSSALPPNQPLLLPFDPVTGTLDKADFNTVSRPQNWSSLPSPLVVNGKRITDTRALANNIRFHDCLFIGSIISDSTASYTQTRNKLQFTGATKFVNEHPDQLLRLDPKYSPDSEDLDAIGKSSMMLPNYSVDIGSFNSPPEQDVRLRGAVIAGVLDVRGNADIYGSLMLTFSPVLGQGPMRDISGQPVGNPADFNATIGYFGPDDGDEESLDPRELPEVGGVKIVGWDLDGDNLPDLGPEQQPTQAQLEAGAVVVPFHGYGSVHLRFDPTLDLPDGIMLPLQMDRRRGSYREGRP